MRTKRYGSISQNEVVAPETLIEEAKKEEDKHSLSTDTYGIFFLADIRSRAFAFALIVYVLKMSLFVLIVLSAFKDRDLTVVRGYVSIAQFISLPIAICMQEDLISAVAKISNVVYDEEIMHKHPSATKMKMHLARVLQFLDGSLSLAINFRIMLTVDTILDLFLNFAALQFLQTVDGIAYEMALNGYLSDDIRKVARDVQTVALPKEPTSLDTIFFVVIWTLMVSVWYYAESFINFD